MGVRAVIQATINSLTCTPLTFKMCQHRQCEYTLFCKAFIYLVAYIMENILLLVII